MAGQLGRARTDGRSPGEAQGGGHFRRFLTLLGWTAPRHQSANLGCHEPRKEPSMGEISRIGLDTSKAVFTLHGVDASGRGVLRLNLRRSQLLAFLSRLPPTAVALEACGSSHHWG